MIVCIRLDKTTPPWRKLWFIIIIIIIIIMYMRYIMTLEVLFLTMFLCLFVGVLFIPYHAHSLPRSTGDLPVGVHSAVALLWGRSCPQALQLLCQVSRVGPCMGTELPSSLTATVPSE